MVCASFILEASYRLEMIVYKIWDRMNGVYVNRYNNDKPNATDWYEIEGVAEMYVPVLCKAWKCDRNNFEIHRYKLAMTRLK